MLSETRETIHVLSFWSYRLVVGLFMFYYPTIREFHTQSCLCRLSPPMRKRSRQRSGLHFRHLLGYDVCNSLAHGSFLTVEQHLCAWLELPVRHHRDRLRCCTSNSLLQPSTHGLRIPEHLPWFGLVVEDDGRLPSSWVAEHCRSCGGLCWWNRGDSQCCVGLCLC